MVRWLGRLFGQVQSLPFPFRTVEEPVGHDATPTICSRPRMANWRSRRTILVVSGAAVAIIAQVRKKKRKRKHNSDAEIVGVGTFLNAELYGVPEEHKSLF